MRLDFGPEIESLRLDFHALMSSNVACFYTWRPHGNRVSKTRFSNPYYHKSPEQYQSILEKKERKKKKKQKNPGHRTRPRQRAAQVTRGPGRACDQGSVQPRPSLPPRSSGFLFGYSENHKVWTCVFSESLDAFSLKSDGCVLDFLSFFFYVFWLEREA